MHSPIAITGIGVVSPTGLTADSVWQSLFAQSDHRGRWAKRQLSDYPVDNVISIPEALWRTVNVRNGGCENRAASLAEFAVMQAMEEARVAPDRMRLGCVLASTTAGVEVVENALVSTHSGDTGATPNDVDGSAILPTRRHRWSGPTAVVSTACSSGLVAPALAIDMLLAGEADAMIAGAVDVLLEYTICGFNGMRLATDDRCRPFSAGRKGVVLSEGAACLCLEPLASARARGARVRAAITGYGMSCDADHLTAPDAGGVARAINLAFETSALAPDAIGGIFAHGTGTQANDITEVRALRAAFGDIDLPPMTAIKSVMGHPQAAAGAFSLVTAVLALERSQLPPTAGLCQIDPALERVDVVCAGGKPLARPNLMVNAFGFGGNNCVMIVSDAAAVHDAPAGAHEHARRRPH